MRALLRRTPAAASSGSTTGLALMNVAEPLRRAGGPFVLGPRSLPGGPHVDFLAKPAQRSSQDLRC
jgi:hypothetical protein